jgi:hypothetical protein
MVAVQHLALLPRQQLAGVEEVLHTIQHRVLALTVALAAEGVRAVRRVQEPTQEQALLVKEITVVSLTLTQLLMA